MAIHVVEEARRCLQCKRPLCRTGCPIQTEIPRVIDLMLRGELDEAGRILFENNPLSTVCGLVCDHEKQCEGHCILAKKGTPIHFSSIETYISSTYTSKMAQGPAPSNGIKTAIIGAGPAGLTIAVTLAAHGYQVTIFENKDKIGGVLRYGIPQFRLPRTVLDEFEYHHLRLKGIKFRPNTTIGAPISVDDLFRDGYRSVFIGTGVWQPDTLGIKGESLGHVHFGVNYLSNPDSFHLGETVAVIGAGNAAMDVARTALRKGVRSLTCYSRSERITASRHEMEYAKLEGVAFEQNRMPVEITDEGVIFVTTQRVDGKLQPIEGTETLVKADSVLISIGQGPKSRIVSTTTGIAVSASGLVVVDENGLTTREGVFASGDVVKGARTVVEAVAHSKKVAQAMHEYMQTDV